MLSILIILIAFFQGLISLLPTLGELSVSDSMKKKRIFTSLGYFFSACCILVIVFSVAAFSISENNNDDNLAMIFEKIDAATDEKPFVESRVNLSTELDSTLFAFCFTNRSATDAHNIYLRFACFRLEGANLVSLLCDTLCPIPRISMIAPGGTHCQETYILDVDLPNEIYFYLIWEYYDKKDTRYIGSGIYLLNSQINRCYSLPDENSYKPFYDVIRKNSGNFNL